VPERHVVLAHRELGDLCPLAAYRAAGGYGQLERAVTSMAPESVIELVKASGLRGRGGAGFPTGVKWSFVPPDVFPRYLAVNNDESEPGTFKDHELTLSNPHQVLEGAAIAAFAIRAEDVYVYCRGEWWQEMAALSACIKEAEAAGCLGQGVFGTDVRIRIHVTPGAGAYICGEETALLSSLEGAIGHPRLKPPFPTTAGVYGRPTVINNVETLANVPPILANGPDWYRQIGTPKSPGTKIFCLSGCVERPGNYELPLGVPFRELLELGGGVWRGRSLKAVLPSGASGPVLPADVALGLDLDWESVEAAGSVLGSASMILIDDATNMAWVAGQTCRFFKHESCGKCTPCREGTNWLDAIYSRLVAGRGRPGDAGLIEDVIASMDGACFCPLGEFAQSLPRSTLAHFPEDYAELGAPARAASGGSGAAMGGGA
jgi:NADH-quinone oxidoreductase subunit F